MLPNRCKRYPHLFGIACGFALALLASLVAAANGQPRATADEEGTFRLHKFEQPIGEEKYSLKEEGDELQLAVNFHFNDRGQDVPLDAYVRFGRDFVPRSMEIHGDVARGTPIDDAVLVEQGRILVRDRNEWRASEPPSQFFTIAGYAPAALQMMLIRRWQAVGQPKKLQTFSAGQLSIEHRGTDEFVVSGAKINLERFIITNLVWGREALWLDSQNRLAALVTVDGEYDHFEAVRPEFEDILGTFVQRAAADEMAALAEISKNLRRYQRERAAGLVAAGTL